MGGWGGGASVNACREVALQLRLGNVGNLQCLFSCRLEIPTRITSSDTTSSFDLASAARPDWFRWLSVYVQCVITALDFPTFDITCSTAHLFSRGWITAILLSTLANNCVSCFFLRGLYHTSVVGIEVHIEFCAHESNSICFSDHCDENPEIV